LVAGILPKSSPSCTECVSLNGTYYLTLDESLIIPGGCLWKDEEPGIYYRGIQANAYPWDGYVARVIGYVYLYDVSCGGFAHQVNVIFDTYLTELVNCVSGSYNLSHFDEYQCNASGASFTVNFLP
jgi:hypothetical protein